MTAQKKIEKLTDSWYGYVLFSAVINVIANGFGIFSLILAAGGLLFSLFLTYIIGRNLQRRGRITRFFCLVGSAFSTVFGAIGVWSLGGQFLSNWSFGLLAQIGMVVVGVMMAVRSFRTLTDSSVKAFFN